MTGGKKSLPEIIGAGVGIIVVVVVVSAVLGVLLAGLRELFRWLF